MRRFSSCAIGLSSLLWGGSALANIPALDAAQLTQRSQTSSTTVKLVPITTQRKDANQGVKCAVTTGKAVSITDPTVQPQAGAGSQAIQAYAPDMPAVPIAGSQGGALSSQTLFQSTGGVVAGLDASRSTLSAAGSSFRSAGQQVGTAPTVMAALDMNSAVRLQNNLAWNSTIGSANLWVTALNALNVALMSDASRAAIGMRATTTSFAIALVCPVGTGGTGTAADPCRPPTGLCSRASAESQTGSSCTASRFVDGDGNGLFVLLPIGKVGATAPVSAPLPLTAADLAAALAAIQSSAR